ncbi:phosphorylcholine transferase LicD [Fibrobacter sp. UWB12]|uniref:LicD family protein n=1 Tax=Fibrobacter sp. UWB12 TaxID=1896203 RepID=UPI0009207EB9|nr:LicD family protein [Fibrobacter sp. UWB12]SHK26387.1 lipopolysaccharide cholinephosphotransferase [Fibrobacter sp. UWB12]
MRLISKIREYGFSGLARKAVLRWLKIENHEEKIKTLNYFLNKFHECSQLPPTDDADLRIMQKCDVVFLGIFDKLCQKHKLTYWLDYGTLLGAVRHHGFIPWDDDTDLAMPREDYNRLTDAFKLEFESLGFSFDERPERPMMSVGLGYKHHTTGIWTDIYPVDTCLADKDQFLAKNNIKAICELYRNYYVKNYYKKKNHESLDKLAEYKQSLFSNLPSKDSEYLIHPMETMAPITVSKPEDIYPIKKMLFDGFELNVPQKTELYLQQMYGKSFMKFPSEGVEHHGGEGTGRPPLKDWAKLNNVDMNEVYEHLLKVYNSL